jgi:hypothetical protein
MPIDCYECRGLGDDYRIEDGELVSNCDGCPNNEIQIEAYYGQDEEVSGDAAEGNKR